jgi:hypothetical protein
MKSTKTITVLSVCSDGTINDKQYDKISRIASRYIGTIYRLAGDSIIIIFGLPTSYENDHERAIEAAGELRSNFSSFRIGISTNDLLIHPDVMLDYKHMELTTEACSLAHIAEPGQIFINSRLYSLIKDIFRCKPHQQTTGQKCYEIIGILEKLEKKHLKAKSSRRNRHSRNRSKSTKKNRNIKSLKKSKTKFIRNLKRLVNRDFSYIYYLLVVIAIIVSILVILMLGC